MDKLPELVIGSVALAPVIVIIIELLKKAGMPVAAAPYVNGVLTVLAYAGVMLLKANPDYLDAATIAVNLVVAFLTAAGLYHEAKSAVKKLKK